MEDALANLATTTYDSVGRPETTIDPLGAVATTVYDSLGREQATVNRHQHRQHDL